MIPIEKDQNGKPEIHYSQVFRVYQQWIKSEAIVKIFENSVLKLQQNKLLDTSVIHGDGSTTMAKKGGDVLGFSGHKHMKDEKIVAFSDRRCNVISPMTIAPGNRHESNLFSRAFNSLKDICKRVGIAIQKSTASLDSAYDSFANRKKIFNTGMIPCRDRYRKGTSIRTKTELAGLFFLILLMTDLNSSSEHFFFNCKK